MKADGINLSQKSVCPKRRRRESDDWVYCSQRQVNYAPVFRCDPFELCDTIDGLREIANIVKTEQKKAVKCYAETTAFKTPDGKLLLPEGNSRELAPKFTSSRREAGQGTTNLSAIGCGRRTC